MELSDAIKFLSKEVERLEQAAYMYETVVKPRADVDKHILENMRTQLLKLRALQEKASRGEDVTQQDVYDAVPQSLR